MSTQQQLIPQPALEELARFPFFEALLGRRSRRFPLGASIPDGPLAYTSTSEPVPLDAGEELLVALAVSGNTGWHYGIMRNERYAPRYANYSGAAGGRTQISGAGFHVSETFFTNDDGVFLLETRDAPALAEPGAPLEEVLDAHRSRIRKVDDERLRIPFEVPWIEGHNTFSVNAPGSTLFIPVGDLAQHLLQFFWYFVQNGYAIYDDIAGEPIRGLEEFADLVDLSSPRPLSFVELHAANQVSVELATGTYAGALALGALGLGGWSFDGIDLFGILGASGDPAYPGLGFRFDADERWSTPNITGRDGVFEAFTPPHHPSLRAAVEALAERKYGAGGPFNPDTLGPWRDSPGVRGGAVARDERLIDAVTTIAEHVHEVHGRFPATVPAVWIRQYLQAHHLDLGFYDEHFGPGAYLETHRRHFETWHAGD